MDEGLRKAAYGRWAPPGPFSRRSCPGGPRRGDKYRGHLGDQEGREDHGPQKRRYGGPRLRHGEDGDEGRGGGPRKGSLLRAGEVRHQLQDTLGDVDRRGRRGLRRRGDSPGDGTGRGRRGLQDTPRGARGLFRPEDRPLEGRLGEERCLHKARHPRRHRLRDLRLSKGGPRPNTRCGGALLRLFFQREVRAQGQDFGHERGALSGRLEGGGSGLRRVRGRARYHNHKGLPREDIHQEAGTWEINGFKKDRAQGMKKLLTLLLIVTVVGFNGCAPPVRYSVTEWFHQLKPETVAVLPVKWGTEWAGGAKGGGSGDAEVARIFRTMSAERLTSMNYRTVSMEEVDRRYPETGREGFKKMAPAQVAQALGVDAVLYISITEWDSSLLATYAYLEMGATFELYGS